MQRKRLPTARCPNCKDFGFLVYRNFFKRAWHQCCNCQLIFKEGFFTFKTIFYNSYDKGEI